MMTARDALVFTRRAATAIAAVGVIQLALAGEYLDEAMYLEFCSSSMVLRSCTSAPVVVLRRIWSPGTIGGVDAAWMFVGFILSRTTRLPSFHESEAKTSGIVTLVLEAGYLAAMGCWLRSPRRRARRARGGSFRFLPACRT